MPSLCSCPQQPKENLVFLEVFGTICCMAEWIMSFKMAMIRASIPHTLLLWRWHSSQQEDKSVCPPICGDLWLWSKWCSITSKDGPLKVIQSWDVCTSNHSAKKWRDHMERPQVGVLADSPAKAQASSQYQPPANVWAGLQMIPAPFLQITPAFGSSKLTPDSVPPPPRHYSPCPLYVPDSQNRSA